VYEDGVRQTVTQFTNERVPIGLGVLLDSSDSMFGQRMEDARHAVDRFLFELLDESDEFFLMAFNHRPRTLTGWTRERGDVQHALAGLRPSGGTAIYDAVLDAMPLLGRRTRQRGALLVISDGADTASTATLRELLSTLRRSDTSVYAIAIDSPDRQPINTRVNPAALREITAESGGRTEIVQSSAQLNEAAARIADELKTQYVLGYTSSRGADGQFHSLRVRSPDRTTVCARATATSPRRWGASATSDAGCRRGTRGAAADAVANPDLGSIAIAPTGRDRRAGDRAARGVRSGPRACVRSRRPRLPHQ